MVAKIAEMSHSAPNLSSPSGDSTGHHLVSANYSKLSDHIRRLTPQGIQCSVFCGGTNCKYENPESWTADSLAIQGLYSHWITDDILAMARPSTVLIAKKNIVQQFESLGIKSIINLQCPKEHASCGHPLEESGFSYDPGVFMENNIYYYNFAWKDYGDATVSALLDMVKVLAFAVSEGRVAVHCHAGHRICYLSKSKILCGTPFTYTIMCHYFDPFNLGLGRTGVLIACYLVYSLRVNANDAIRYVRYRRPGSVQTRGQILCVRYFAQFILPLTTTYFIRENASKDKYMVEFTLSKFLRNQKIVLHGYDERKFKYLPKIIHVICERILQLCGCWTQEFINSTQPYTNNFLTARTHANIPRHESTYSISSASSLDENKLYPPDELRAISPSTSTGSCSDLSTLDGEDGDETALFENKCFQELETQKQLNRKQSLTEQSSYRMDDVVNAMLIETSQLDGHVRKWVCDLQNEINTSNMGWLKLSKETDLCVLVAMLYEWLECLKAPVLKLEHLEYIVVHYKQPELCFEKFDLEDAFLVEYLLNFLSKIRPVSEENLVNLLKRCIAALAHRGVTIGDRTIYADRNLKRLQDGTLHCTIMCFQNLLDMVYQHHSQDVVT